MRTSEETYEIVSDLRVVIIYSFFEFMELGFWYKLEKDIFF